MAPRGSTARDGRSAASSLRARRVVLAIMLCNALWVMVPWRLAAPPGPLAEAAWLGAHVVAAVTMGGVMYVAATWPEAMRSASRTMVLVASAVRPDGRG